MIAALGAPAGGLEAFEKVLKHMPPDARVAIIIFQHLRRSYQRFARISGQIHPHEG